MEKLKFIETYNSWDIHQDKDGRFFICGDYLEEETFVFEDDIDKIKNIIDCL